MLRILRGAGAYVGWLLMFIVIVPSLMLLAAIAGSAEWWDDRPSAR